MTDLTLEELNALQDEVDRDDSPVVELSRPNFDALLAMARELVRLKSALHHLDKRCFATAKAIFADRGQHPDDRESENENMSADGIIEWATLLGWEDGKR